MNRKIMGLMTMKYLIKGQLNEFKRIADDVSNTLKDFGHNEKVGFYGDIGVIDTNKELTQEEIKKLELIYLESLKEHFSDIIIKRCLEV